MRIVVLNYRSNNVPVTLIKRYGNISYGLLGMANYTLLYLRSIIVGYWMLFSNSSNLLCKSCTIRSRCEMRSSMDLSAVGEDMC